MNRYLQGEARWAREKELEAQKRVDELRSPKHLDRLRGEAEREIKRLEWQHRAEMEGAKLRLKALGPDDLADTLARHEKDAKHWRQLAEGHEARLAQTGDDALFEEA